MGTPVPGFPVKMGKKNQVLELGYPIFEFFKPELEPSPRFPGFRFPLSRFGSDFPVIFDTPI
jgi:hypothetical protein